MNPQKPNQPHRRARHYSPDIVGDENQNQNRRANGNPNNPPPPPPVPLEDDDEVIEEEEEDEDPEDLDEDGSSSEESDEEGDDPEAEPRPPLRRPAISILSPILNNPKRILRQRKLPVPNAAGAVGGTAGLDIRVHMGKTRKYLGGKHLKLNPAAESKIQQLIGLDPDFLNQLPTVLDETDVDESPGEESEDDSDTEEPEPFLQENGKIGMDEAAFQSRLPVDRLATQEAVAFPDVAHGAPATQKLYLYFRNKILQLWLENPKKETTFDIVWKSLEPPYDSDRLFVKRIHAYLDRHGYINFGVFEKVGSPTKSKGLKAIVIGAGIAGLTAARQLTRFGLEVVVLEARDRAGGRICTFRKNDFVADLGAMVVTGLGGNPIGVLSKQIDMELHKIRQKCPLYQSTGEPVPEERDVIIEKEFNRLLETTSYLSHGVDLSYANSRPISLGEALEWSIKMQDKRVKEIHNAYMNKQIEFLEKRKELSLKLLTAKSDIDILRAAYDETMKEANSNDEEPSGSPSKKSTLKELRIRAATVDLNTAIEEYDETREELDAVEKEMEELESNPPVEQYLSITDRQILDWHFANLEFANAAPLSNLSLKHWDQDDDYEFTGNHLTKIVHADDEVELEQFKKIADVIEIKDSINELENEGEKIHMDNEVSWGRRNRVLYGN